MRFIAGTGQILSFTVKITGLSRSKITFKLACQMRTILAMLMNWPLKGGIYWRVRVLLENRRIIQLLVFLLGTHLSTESWGQDLSPINSAFALRLEAGVRYQEAVLPVNVSTLHSYLKLSGKKYLLVRGILNRAEHTQLQEYYELRRFDNQLQTLLHWRYYQSGPLNLNTIEPPRYSYWSGSIMEGTNGQQISACLVQDFTLEDLLNIMRSPRSMKGHTFSIIDTKTGSPVDTLASYKVERSDTLPGWTLTLYERSTHTQRRWRNNNVPYQQWNLYSYAHGKWCLESNRNGLHWKRLYRNANDFTETLEESALDVSAGGGATIQGIVYQRRFHRTSSHRTIDRYTLPQRKRYDVVLSNKACFTVITNTK